VEEGSQVEKVQQGAVNLNDFKAAAEVLTEAEHVIAQVFVNGSA